MSKNRILIFGLMVCLMTVAGCGKEPASPEADIDTGINNQTEEKYIPAEEIGDVPTVMEEYAETKEYQELADFLAVYYQIPEELWQKTRYYYNLVDLNEDGTDEIFAVVISDEWKNAAGDPALILKAEEDGTFTVLEAFDKIHTPVTILDNTTNGWHDILLKVYGGGDSGYLVCHYNINGGYQTDLNEFYEELEPASGTQILSNNLIDDLDQGNYLTIAPQEEE